MEENIVMQASDFASVRSYRIGEEEQEKEFSMCVEYQSEHGPANIFYFAALTDEAAAKLPEFRSLKILQEENGWKIKLYKADGTAECAFAEADMKTLCDTFKITLYQ